MGIIHVAASGFVMLIVVGLIWLIGMNLLAHFFTAMPQLAVDNPYYEQQETLKTLWTSIVTFVPGVFFLFFIIKTLINASRRGAD